MQRMPRNAIRQIVYTSGGSGSLHPNKDMWVGSFRCNSPGDFITYDAEVCDDTVF